MATGIKAGSVYANAMYVRRVKIIFLFLVITQGLHSVEEYLGRLWEVFSPTAFICSIVSDEPERGFILINIGLIIFGIACCFFCTRQNNIRGYGLIWFWIITETVNGIIHPLQALMERSYFPGLITAPFLLLLALFLAKTLQSKMQTGV